MATALSLSFPQPDIALITFDLPGKGANILSRSVLDDLAGLLDQMEKRKDLRGLVIKSGKPGTFIAGADIREFLASLGAPKSDVVAMCRRGQQLFQRLSQGTFVSVAAIDGICVGGGSEMSVWCDRRVMSDNPKSEIGFPEVKLGLYPGWGGTVRAPRIVGLANALEMITAGENVDARGAMMMGLASDVVPADKLLDAAIGVIRAEKQTGQYLRRADGVGVSGRDGLGHDPAGNQRQLSRADGGAGIDAGDVPASRRRGAAARGRGDGPALWLAGQRGADQCLFSYRPEQARHWARLGERGASAR
jgi:enoyl-CoA hydratase/carnithine racemase